jgi:hypothetical protein
MRANEALSELTVAVYAWRNAPPDPPALSISEVEWMRKYEKSLNRRAEVEQHLFDCYHNKRPLPDAEECKSLALKLGMSNAPELKITPGPLILSPPDRLSDEEVWMRALESATRGQWNGATKIADHALDAFREKFRKESK